MKHTNVVLSLLAVFTLALPLAAQQAVRLSPSSAVYGRLEPKVLASADNEPTDEELPPLTTYTGKFVVNFTITISSSVPTSTTIACSVGVVVIDVAGDLSEDLSVTATRNGSTATCSVTLPYSWSLTAATDTVFVSYDVSAPPQPLTSTSTYPRRYTAHPISKITVPTSGSTTTYAVTPTI
jgi:hypothetical protein